VRARRVLLDALAALAFIRSSVFWSARRRFNVHSGEATFGVVPYTTDADLAIDPRLLQKTPPI